MFIVCRVNYEYDDEGYTMGNNGPTYDSLIKSFSNKEEAESYALELNLVEFRRENPFEFDPYRWGNSATNDEEIKNIFNKYNQSYNKEELNCGYESWNLPQDISDEDLLKLYNHFSALEFYKVVEVN